MNIKNKKEIIRLESIQGHNNKCHIKIINFPICKGKGGYRFLNHKYSSDLIMDKMWSCKGPESIFSSVMGFIKKKHKCPVCFCIFEEINPAFDVISVRIQIEDKIPFELEISMPMVICKKCNKKLIIRKTEFTYQMELALCDAFDKLEIAYY